MINQTSLEKFNKIYDQTYKDIEKYVVCKCNNMEDVNDIIQDTYIEVYKKIVKNELNNSTNSYIIGIAKNKLKKYYGLLYKIKRITIFKKENDEIDLLDNIPDKIDIEKIVLDTNDIDRIWIYLNSKKIVIQKIFYLYYNLDLTIKEISMELNLSESYIKNCLYRTLKQLKEYLRKDFD